MSSTDSDAGSLPPGVFHNVKDEIHASSPNPPLLSKNAQKRLLKAERRAETKSLRRAREKELKKQKKRTRVEQQAEEGPPEKKPRTEKHTVRPFNARVVIDLGFDELMSAKECVSLCSQLSHTYSSHRKSSTPFSSLLFTSLHGRVKEQLDGANQSAYRRWRRVEFWEDGYEKLWSSPRALITDDTAIGGSSEPDLPLEFTEQSKVVYLTADSKEELEELKEGETYIIGGIVDKNRYKNLCLEKGSRQNIRTARLPIGRFLSELTTRKVLTVNQVFDILLRWVERRDWEAAIRDVMPQRKMKDNKTREIVGLHQAPQEVEAYNEDRSGDGALATATTSGAESEP